MLVHQLIYQGEDDKVVFCGKDITYRELREEVVRYRCCLYSCGIRSGDNVGLFLRNSVEFIYSYMAVTSLGAVVVPLNFQFTSREIAYIVNDARIKHILTKEKLDLSLELGKFQLSYNVEQILISEVNTCTGLLPQIDLETDFCEDDPCVIIYTSGTTGSPKGAVLSHKNLISNAAVFTEVLPITNQDNVLCVLPMYHCFAWTCAVLNPLYCGAAITILESFSPKETIAAIKEYGVTIMYGVPPMYNLLCRAGEAVDLEGLRFCISGGAALPQKVAELFREKYGLDILEGYGLSEASPVVALNLPRKPKKCSIGKALPNLRVKIVNGKGDELPPGEVGELTVYGPSVMQGYYNLPLETSRVIKEGWLHTGDLAYKDMEGYLFIVDRIRDLIITNGENIYPREIEEILYNYIGILEAAVIGIDDELRGQAAHAYLVVSDPHHFDKKKLIAFLQTHLAAFKIPKEIIIVDSLPKNQTGKILKRILRTKVSDGRAG